MGFWKTLFLAFSKGVFYELCQNFKFFIVKVNLEEVFAKVLDRWKSFLGYKSIDF